MKNQFFKLLLTKISQGSATEEELLLYQKWYDKQLLEEIDPEELDRAKSGVSQEIFARLQPLINDGLDEEPVVPAQRKVLFRKTWLVAAAVATIVVSFGIYFLQQRAPMQIIQQEYRQVNFDTTQGVILTLADGKKLDLSSITSDDITHLTDTKVAKIEDGIQYDESTTNQESIAGQPQEEAYHTLYTPAGKTYHIVLGDGTKVWLNAKSMLRFPIHFVGDERRVQLIGEGYFEVIHDSPRPFIVESKGQELKVLGTKFNIDAYEDVATVKSTLVEGKVQITARGTNRGLVLSPGEQSVLRGDHFHKQSAMLKNVLGWKNGIFAFHNEKLDDICHTLSRWYNVEFDSSENPKILNQIFSGTVPQFSTVDEVLAVLSATGTINYQREERRIIFMK